MQKRFKVALIIRRMGRKCSSCKQEFECEVMAESQEFAVVSAKLLSGANPNYHQFSIKLIKELQ